MNKKPSTINHQPSTINHRGFTLIEVFLAMVIMAGSLFVLIQAHSSGVARNYEADNLSMATMLARAKMAEVELEGFPETGSSSGNFSEEGHPNFNWDLMVREAVLSEMAPEIAYMAPEIIEGFSEEIKDFLREVRLNVMWRDGGKDRTLEIITYIADREIEK